MASRSERYNVELTADDKASQVINEVAEAREKLSDEPVVVDITADDVPDGINEEDHAAGLASSLANLAKHVER